MGALSQSIDRLIKLTCKPRLRFGVTWQTRETFGDSVNDAAAIWFYITKG